MELTGDLMTTRYTSRQVASLILIVFGGQTLLSAMLINPWAAPLWFPDYADHLDVITSYCAVAVTIGLVLLLLARSLAHAASPRAGKIAMLILIVLALVLADRFVLVFLGLKQWTHDPVLHFRNRPDITRSLAGYGRRDKVMRFNHYGQLDDQFPVAKPAGEFRLLMIGDSTTMGFGVPKEETIAHYLERMLDETDTRYASHQVINAAVHGYNTTQEVEMLRLSMRFEPDVIVIGFTLNDITEPYIVDRKFGGTGFDYHGVLQTSNQLIGWVLSDTGIGRIIQEAHNRQFDYLYVKRQEEFTVRDMVQSGPDEPKFKKGWQSSLAGLDEMYAIAKQSDIPVVLIIFPFTFQIGREHLLGPQRLVTKRAAKQYVQVIDVASLLEPLVDPGSKGLAVTGQVDQNTVMNVLLRRFYLDQNHLKAEGHQVVGRAIHDYLVRDGLINAPLTGQLQSP
jgi:lysophospholipase L1-like esterase